MLRKHFAASVAFLLFATALAACAPAPTATPASTATATATPTETSTLIPTAVQLASLNLDTGRMEPLTPAANEARVRTESAFYTYLQGKEPFKNSYPNVPVIEFAINYGDPNKPRFVFLFGDGREPPEQPVLNPNKSYDFKIAGNLYYGVVDPQTNRLIIGSLSKPDTSAARMSYNPRLNQVEYYGKDGTLLAHVPLSGDSLGQIIPDVIPTPTVAPPPTATVEATKGTPKTLVPEPSRIPGAMMRIYNQGVNTFVMVTAKVFDEYTNNGQVKWNGETGRYEMQTSITPTVKPTESPNVAGTEPLPEGFPLSDYIFPADQTLHGFYSFEYGILRFGSTRFVSARQMYDAKNNPYVELKITFLDDGFDFNGQNLIRGDGQNHTIIIHKPGTVDDVIAGANQNDPRYRALNAKQLVAGMNMDTSVVIPKNIQDALAGKEPVQWTQPIGILDNGLMNIRNSKHK